jgi:hypothetical protein
MSFSEEHGHAHARHTGLPWLDLILALSVVVISVVSLVVSVSHGKTMEKLVEENGRLVAAQTLPFLQFDSGDVDPVTHEAVITVRLRNGGVGPAVLEWLQLSYKGQAYPNAGALLDACCREGGGRKFRVVSSSASGVLPARETLELMQVRSADSGPEAFRTLDAERTNFTARACYCSVLDECWLTDFGTERPKPVKSCKVPGVVPFR